MDRHDASAAAIVWQAIRFLVTGALNTAVGLTVIYLCWRVVGLSEVVSNLIGYCVGLCVSFFVNRRWTFRSGRGVLQALPVFLAVFAAAYLANLATLVVLLRVLEVRMEWATLAATVPYTIVFYLGGRWFVFPSESRNDPQPLPVRLEQKGDR